MLYRVYVDEAGNRGISAASSDHFVISALLVRDSDESHLRQQLAALRVALRRGQGHHLHFVKFSHSDRLKAAQDIAASAAAAVVNVIVHKDLIGQPMPAGNMAHISRPDPMYLWSVRLLLERVSWYVDEHGGTDAIVTFAHVKGIDPVRVHAYRQALENTPGTQIRWPVYSGHPFRVESPKQIELLQLPDTTASALYHAVEPDRHGNRETRYLDALSPKLYRRGTAAITSYGLKVFPTAAIEPGGSLEWLKGY